MTRHRPRRRGRRPASTAGDGVAEGYGALGAEEPAYREDCRDRKTGVAEGNQLPAAGPRRGHVPPVQTDPRRQSPCEGVRGAAARSDGGVHGAEHDVGAREGAVLRGRGVTVGDFDTGSVPWRNHATTPHLGRNIRQWLGNSRGHWDGETLVVETINFTDRTKFSGSTPRLHLVERFTRLDADTLT